MREDQWISIGWHTMEYDQKIIEAGIEIILTISEERKGILEKLKQALIANDMDKVVEYGMKICGMN